MSKLMAFFSRQKQAVDQQHEIKKLKAEVEKLRDQNESMRAGMRRCTSCDYRIDYKKRQGKT